MKKNQEAFVGIDTATTHNAVAEVGRNGEVRYLGTFENTSGAVTKLIRKLAVRYETLHFYYGAGPGATGGHEVAAAASNECAALFNQACAGSLPKTRPQSPLRDLWRDWRPSPLRGSLLGRASKVSGAGEVYDNTGQTKISTFQVVRKSRINCTSKVCSSVDLG